MSTTTSSSISSIVWFGFKKLIIPKRGSIPVTTSRGKTSIVDAETTWMVTDVTLRVRYYHKSLFSPTFHFILKMSKYALHNSLYFRRTNPPYVPNWQRNAYKTDKWRWRYFSFGARQGLLPYVSKIFVTFTGVHIWLKLIRYLSYAHSTVVCAKSIKIEWCETIL